MSVPLLIQTRQDLSHPHPAARKAPLAHRHTDGIRVVDGEATQADRPGPVSSKLLCVVGCTPLPDLHSEGVRHPVPIVARKVYRARLKDGGVGKPLLHPHSWGKAPILSGEHITHKSNLIRRPI